MPIAMILSALAFYIPRMIWKWLESGCLAQACNGLAILDMEEMNYTEEIVGHDLSHMYDLDVVIPSAGTTQTLLGATSGTEQDPATITRESTMNVSYHNSTTLKHVNRLLNFFRVFRVTQRNYAANFFMCQFLNAVMTILQVNAIRLCISISTYISL